MAAVNGNHVSESAAIAHVAAAERLARALVVALDLCEEEGVPLSDGQKIAVVEAMLLEFDGFGVHLSSLESVDRALHDIGHGWGARTLSDR